ncbi:DUF2243 domain-containing protein [Massilia sp. H6]|uniref:DUF2243 domain-containing protein n=1 Tax=Massilia sp. H6 TaxID=2970464 RepID=UPI002169043C|nr:DUF2243 domain-containing protein [Massilia sp. H6]UVW28071.1 DUF2243 domain-containing protein [Massilia sp. H6]
MWKASWVRWAVALGFALGGFFDGILLHQILQWHHLLSQVAGMDDLRLQVLWDGYFHALMYVIALAALAGLWWQQHQRAAASIPGWPLLGALLVGFGAWHIADTVLSHWLLQIHRIRIDSANPLLWDLLWLAGFGILPLALGLRLLRKGAGGGLNGAAAMLVLAAVTSGAGAWALLPPAQTGLATVVFAPGAGPRQVFAALDALDARLVWSDRAMAVVVVAVPAQRRWDFYRHGALLVSGAGVPAGCFNWSRG